MSYYRGTSRLKNRLLTRFLGALTNKMEKKGKKAKIIIVAIMRKLVHMIFGIIKHKKKFNPDLYLSS